MSKPAPNPAVSETFRVAFDQDGVPCVVRIREVRATSTPRTQEFDQETLQAAFNKVCDPEDWKMPIDAVIDARDQELVDLAIAHMAYGYARFESLANGKMRVRAPGYYRVEASLERGQEPQV